MHCRGGDVFAAALRTISMQAAPWVLGAVAVLVAAVWIWMRVAGKKRWQRLEHDDPQLAAIFRNLEADKREGRL